SNSSGRDPRADATADASTPASTTATPSTAPASSNKELSVPDIVKQSEGSVVRIETATGVGSGFVIGEEGYIMTNNHVVSAPSGAISAQIVVTSSDGAEERATVVGRDPRTDLALLQIGQTGLTPLPLGEPSQTAVGQSVVAIGDALDLEGGEGPAF